MVNFKDYYCVCDQKLTFTNEQGSRFAKKVAGDFNPIHDKDSRYFRVPGDLLFAFVVSQYGLATNTVVSFEKPVTANVALCIPNEINGYYSFNDADEKQYITVDLEGDQLKQSCARDLALQFIQFSGEKLLWVLVNLMKRENAMINTRRPLVVYKSICLNLEHDHFEDPHLEYHGATMKIEGKKGEVRLDFVVRAGEIEVGRGSKSLQLRGLRAFDQTAMDKFVDDYTDPVERAGK